MATKTFEELKQMAIQIRDEKTNKQNTATRIGTQMLEHLNKLEQDYYDKTTLDKRVTELNISVLYPTLGVNGTNKYTLAGAIAQVPAEYRTIIGLKITFINNDTSKSETWKYNGGEFTNITSWSQGSEGGNKILIWKTDVQTTRKQIPLKERKGGLQISYLVPKEGWVNEQYIGDTFSDGVWELDANWDKIIAKKDIFRLVSESFLSNLVDTNCSLYPYLTIVDGIDYNSSVGQYVSNDNIFYVEISKTDCPTSILFVNQSLQGNKPLSFAYVKDGVVNKQSNIGNYGIKFTQDFDRVQIFFNKDNGLAYLSSIVTLFNKIYNLSPTSLNDYKVRGNSMLDIDNALIDVNINVNVNGYLENRVGYKIYPLFKVTQEDKIWANKYYSVAFFAFDDKANIIKNGTFKTQTGLGMQASYFQMSDYAELEGLDHIYLGVSSNISDLVVTNDKVANEAEYWITNPNLPKEIGSVEEAPADDNQYCRKNHEWVKIEATGGAGLEDTQTYNLFDGEVTNAYITPDKGIETPNTGYRVTTNFIQCPSEGVISVKGVTSGHIYCYKEDGTYIPTREQNTQGASEPYLIFIAQKDTEKIKFEYLEKNKTGDIVIKIGGGANSLPYIEPTKQAIPYNKLQLLRSVNMLDMQYWWTNRIIDLLGDSISQNPGYPYFIDLALGSMTQWHGIGGTRLSGNASNAFWQDSRINSLSDDASLIIIAGGTNDRSSYTLGDLSKDNTDTNTLCGAINVLLSKLYYRYMGMDGYYSSISYAGVNRVTERNINILFILPPKVIETNNKVIEISDDIISVLNLWGIPFVDTCRMAGINEMNKLWFYKHYTDGTIIDPTHGQLPFFERISRLIVDKILQITPIVDIPKVEASVKTYTVSYSSGTGYTINAYNNSVSPVEEGGDYSIQLTILEGYNGRSAVVKANGEVIEKDDVLSSLGLDIYTVKNITQNITITVEGVIIE